MIDQTRFFVTQKYKVANAVATGVINANDIVITSDTHELLFVDDRNQVIPITTTKEEIGLGNVTNNAQINGRASGIVPGHVMTWGANGYTANDSGYTIASNVPANAVFTDTTYQVATPYAGGLLSGSDKEKLDSIERGAQVNVTYNTATQSTAGLMSAADKVKLDNMDGSTAPAYDPATTTADGLMSASDKAKLDGIESGAQVNVEYPVATPVKNGLMSTADKIKLDSLENYVLNITDADIPNTIARTADLGSFLPEVTASNNNSILKVVNGQWAITVDTDRIFTFIITDTETSGQHTCNRTYAEIEAAHDAGKIFLETTSNMFYSYGTVSARKCQLYKIYPGIGGVTGTNYTMPNLLITSYIFANDTDTVYSVGKVWSFT